MTRRPRRGRIVGAALAVIIGAVITTGLSGCSIFGGIVNQQLSTEQNLAKQRKAAAEFVGAHPDTEAITFTREQRKWERDLGRQCVCPGRRSSL